MIHLYSQECVDLLRTALQKAEADLEPTLTYHDTRLAYNNDSSSSEEEGGDSDQESSTSSQGDELKASSDNDTDTSMLDEPDTITQTTTDQTTISPTKRQGKRNSKERQREALIRDMGTPPVLQLPLDDALALNVPSALLSKHDRQYSVASCTHLLNLAQNLSAPHAKPVIVLLVRSGRFAGGVFCREECLQHRTCQRYTVRKGQGKAQSAQDSSSRKPKSMGAQLRRQGEVSLWQDVTDTLTQWKKHFTESPLILVSCPKTMQKGLWEAGGDVLNRNLVRKIPLNVGQPTYESVVAAHEIMMQTVVGEQVVTAVSESVEEGLVDESTPQNVTSDSALKSKEQADNIEKEVAVKEFPSLTPLHVFAAEGNVESLQQLQQLLVDDAEACAELMDHGAGPDCMTALHYAAESASNDSVDPESAAAIVKLLLIQGKANPTVVDARNRVPYFLAQHEKVREAFRRARAELGEECWDWDASKVGPALTDQDVANKKEKAAEKKRRQRARQKEKKAREKAEAQAMEQRKMEEEEKRKQEEDAKRIRDGLAPKMSTATNVCDYCQTVCKGKRRNQMFQRLDYVYCSSECVQKHKRELMAQAALSRLG